MRNIKELNIDSIISESVDEITDTEINELEIFLEEDLDQLTEFVSIKDACLDIIEETDMQESLKIEKMEGM